jgi:hypothetical protein
LYQLPVVVVEQGPATLPDEAKGMVDRSTIIFDPCQPK